MSDECRSAKVQKGEGKKRGRVMRHTLFSDPPRMADGCFWIRQLGGCCCFGSRKDAREMRNDY